jgi:hypothetical protein
VNVPHNHVTRLMDFGYTEPEARFLYIVATHSGYFTLRQYLQFTGAHRGKRSSAFARKLLNNGHAAVRDYMGYGSIYHLFSRTLYGEIEKGNLRNRRSHSFDFIRTRLVLLDFVLGHGDVEYLETEKDKVDFFCETLGIAQEFLPAKVYEGAPGSRPTVRYFVDKFPMFLVQRLPASPPVVTLSYVDSGSGTMAGFLTHLGAYQPLFRQLASFRFFYISPKDAQFRRVAERFRSAVQRPLESDVSSEILRYFQVRKRFDNRQYVIPVTADFEFLNDARRRFHGERFETLYEKWNSGALPEGDLRSEFSQLTPARSVAFETVLVAPHRSHLVPNEANPVNVA